MEGKMEESVADDKSKSKTFKWKVKGRVVARGLSQPGTEGCTHPTLMKDMCAECGADLRENPGQAGARKTATSASVAMVHSIPELIVSEEEALEIGKADEKRLLQSRKLVLLVDLDQTLIHTTNDNIPANLKGVYHFQLAHGNSVMWYHTRLRPNTEDFLKKISTLYELHICTFGVRLYAHTIANFLDPEGKYFSHRILSRDECFSSNSKIPNLKALFPCGDSMVAIIDDREDVWSYSPNLIHVKPYHFFQGTADINAPPGCTKKESDSDPVKHRVRRISHTSDGHSQVVETDENGSSVVNVESDSETAPTKTPDNDVTENNGKDNVSKISEPKTKESDPNSDIEAEVCATEVVAVLDTESDNKQQTKDNQENEEKDGDKTETKEAEVSSQEVDVQTVSEEIEWVDDDDYLYHLEEILTRVHKAFYDVYDQMTQKPNVEKVPDMKSIIPYVKKKVLKGVNIVFSGVFPTNMIPEKSRAYMVAKALGANIHTNFIGKSNLGEGDSNEQTTHVIAARLGTVKVRSAQKSKSAFLVTPDWLWCCNDRWERVDERLFKLTEETQNSLPAKRCSPDVTAQDPQQTDTLKRKNDTPVEEVFVYDRVTGKRIQPNKRRKTPDRVSSFPESSSNNNDSPEASETSSTTPDEKFAKSYNPLYAFSDEDIANMDKEVEELMDSSDKSDSSEDEKQITEVDEVEDAGLDEKTERELRRKVLGKMAHDSSSEEDSLSGDFPRGWKMKKKLIIKGKLKPSPEAVEEENSRDVDADENQGLVESEEDTLDRRLQGEVSDKSDDSIGSVDDIIADAVEKEFLS